MTPRGKKKTERVDLYIFFWGDPQHSKRNTLTYLRAPDFAISWSYSISAAENCEDAVDSQTPRSTLEERSDSE